MESSVIRKIHRLRPMTVGELRIEWEKLYGQASRSRNRDFLFRRLAWRVQELQHGGLSDHTKARIDELGPDAFTRARTSSVAAHATSEPVPATTQTSSRRDPRLPSPGTVLLKEYRGNSIRVLATQDGYEWDGHHFQSLSAVARAITGAKWNGRLFFGLTKRKRH